MLGKMGMGLGLGVGAFRPSVEIIPPWSPLDLGDDLLAWWDAEDASTLTLNGSAVAAWADKKHGYSVSQAVGASRPVWSASGFNSRPGVTFDGTDDMMFMASQPFPSGASPLSVWPLVSQDVAAAAPGTRVVFHNGSATVLAQTRYLRRTVISGENRASWVVGNGASLSTLQGDTIDFTGRHFVRARSSGTDSYLAVDNATEVSAPSVPNIAASGNTSIGSILLSGAASGFWLGVVNSLIITLPLDADQQTALRGFLSARGGIA